MTVGYATTNFGNLDDEGRGITIQSDGKLVANGFADMGGRYGFALARYNTNGTLDGSYGASGRVVTDFAGSNADASFDAVLQGDGKIVLCGYTNNIAANSLIFALARYNTDGSLDTAFNSTGMVTTSISGKDDDEANFLLLQSDGKLVAVGITDTVGSGSNYNFALARYSGTDGSLDTGFNSTGIVITSFGGTDDEARGGALQSDGKILAGGATNAAAGAYDWALARYTTAGALDTTFNSTGKVTTDFGSTDESIDRIQVQGDGKIVCCGWNHLNARYNWALARYNTNGSLDTGFNSTGKLTIDWGTDSSANGMVLDSNGKIVVAGYTMVGGHRVPAIMRFNTDGSTDTSFGVNGQVITGFTDGGHPLEAAIQADGKIVVVSTTTIDSTGIFRFLIARYYPDGSVDASFNPPTNIKRPLFSKSSAFSRAFLGTGLRGVGVA